VRRPGEERLEMSLIVGNGDIVVQGIDKEVLMTVRVPGTEEKATAKMNARQVAALNAMLTEAMADNVDDEF